MADTTDPLVITLSGAAIRTGPDHSSADKGRSAIITGIGPIAAATGPLFEIQLTQGVRGISDGPDRPEDLRLEAGHLTSRLLQRAATHRPTTAVWWTNVRNVCHKLTYYYPVRRALANGPPPHHPRRPDSPPPRPVSTTRPSRPARGNPGMKCIDSRRCYGNF